MPQRLITEQPLLFLRHRGVVSLLLAALSVLVYLNSFPGTFIQDDFFIVKNNALVQNFDLRGIFTSDYWKGMENSGLYRPLTILSLALNRMLTGPEPWGFHLVNVLLHGGVTVLVWLTLLRWNASKPVALLAALCFAVHPIHTEVVNIVVGRSELLVAAFALLALCFARTDDLSAHLVVWGCFALALLSKEHAIVLLALVPLADLWLDGLGGVKSRWRLYLGMLIVAGGWLLLRHYGVQQDLPPTPYSKSAVPLAYLPWDVRILTALQYQWVYLAKLFYPVKLHAAYSLADLPPPIETLWSLRGALVVAVTAGAVAGIAIGWRSRQLWVVLVIAYLLACAPTANIVMPIGVIMAERLAYFPSVWFCATLGWLFCWFREQGTGWWRVVWAGACVYLLFLSILTVVRNRDYVSEIALWQREVLVNETDFLAWHSYGQSLSNSHRYEEAERAYREMLQLQPKFQGGQRSYFTFLFEHGRYREAIAVAERTLALSREQADVTGIAYDQVNLATAYLELKEYGQALAYLEAVDPAYFQQKDIYYGFLGRALQAVGKDQAAVAVFEKIGSYALDLNTPLYYGISLFNLGRYEEARSKLREAIRLNERPEAWNLIGTIAAQQQQYAEAIEAFGRAVELAPGQRHYQENLDRAKQLATPSR